MTDFWLEGSDEGKALGDVLVNGRPVREWKVSDFAGDAEEMRNFESAVWASVATGDHLHEIFGQEFHDDFYSRRSRLTLNEQRHSRGAAMLERVSAHVGGRCKIKLIQLFQFPHIGWEMDNDYLLLDVDGVIRVFGTDHGRLCELDYADLARMKLRLSGALEELVGAMETFAEGLRNTR